MSAHEAVVGRVPTGQPPANPTRQRYATTLACTCGADWGQVSTDPPHDGGHREAMRRYRAHGCETQHLSFPEIEGGFGTIVVDPPWQYNAATKPLRSGGRGGQAEHAYPTMTNDDLAELPVGAVCAKQAHIYMWVTNPRLIGDHRGKRDVTPFDIVDAWGFTPITLLTWVKPGRGGLGWYFRGQTEHVIFGTRGKLGIPAALREPNVFTAPRGRHSQKPAAFFEMVERLSPRPRVELFAREFRMGWETWGNEVDSTQVGGGPS